MDHTKYNNDLPYPRRPDFTTKYWYKGGVCVARRGPDGNLVILVPGIDHHDIPEIKTTETIVDESAYKLAFAAYGQFTATLLEMFKIDLFRELGIEDHPKREKLFAKAWEHGHSAGYGEVETYAWDLLDLIKD